MRDEKGRFVKGYKIDPEIVEHRVVTRKTHSWHSEAAKLAISEGQKKNLDLIENRRKISFMMGKGSHARVVHPLSKEERRKGGLAGWSLEKCRLGGLAFCKKYPNPRFYDTQPELEMKKCLTESSINFIHQYPVYNIEHKFIADFYLPLYNTVIEVDELKSHRYPKGNKKDHVRTHELEQAGYRVLRFWEGQFNPQMVRQNLGGNI